MTSKQNTVDFGKAVVKATSFSPAVSVVAADVEAAIAAKDEIAALSAAVALLGSLTGSVDGTIADVSAIALATSGGNTYSDAAVNTAVNTAITSINLQHKELETSLNLLVTKVSAIISALKA